MTPNGSDFKRGEFQGAVMARLDSIGDGVAACHKGLGELRNKLETRIVKDVQGHEKMQADIAVLRSRQRTITAGISGGVTVALLAIKAGWDWMVRGGN